jgi:signal peptidase I
MKILKNIMAYQGGNYKSLFVFVYQILTYFVISTAAAILIRIFIGEVYFVPTGSMEGTLLKSDVIWVNKLRYGPKIPLNISHIPFFGTLFSEDSASKSNFIRVRGYNEIKRNDILVFKLGESMADPTYIKRCVGLPGDLFEIDKNNLIVNNIFQDETDLLKFSFRIKGASSTMARVLAGKLDAFSSSRSNGVDEDITCLLSVAEKHKLEKKGIKLERIFMSSKTPNISPMSMKGIWNDYQYGPIRIPKKGMRIILNDSTLNLYMDLFKSFEKFDVHKNSAGKYYCLNKQVKEYTVKHDYFFMMGDNRHAALDSRHFGFVPKEFIDGNVKWSLFNYEKFGGLFNKLK